MVDARQHFVPNGVKIAANFFLRRRGRGGAGEADRPDFFFEARLRVGILGLLPICVTQKSVAEISTIAYEKRRTIVSKVPPAVSMLVFGPTVTEHRVRLDAAGVGFFPDGGCGLKVIKDPAANLTDPATLVALGMACAAQGKWTEAVQQYQRALALKPDFIEAYDRLGDIFQKVNRLAEAIAHYRSALSIKPDIAGIQVKLGCALAQQSKLAEATAEANAAATLPDHMSFPHFGLGVLFATCGLAQAARVHLDLALQRDPMDRNGARIILSKAGIRAAA